MSELLEAALKYADHGWYVFPLVARDKIPCTSHGVKDASTHASQIREWWRRWPDANIGMACGPNSGVYVVDVDVAEDGSVSGLHSLVTEFDPLPATVQQYTPRGGFHAFYQAADPPANKNSFRPGVDIRGDGYYVVLAPSIHPNGGQYAWKAGCAPWEMQLAEYPDSMRPAVRPSRPTAAATPAPIQPGLPGWTCDNAERASLYLAQCDPAIQGQAGHDSLFWAAGCMTHGCELSADRAYDILVREYNPRCIPPWNLAEPKDEKDFRRKITESIKRPPDKPRGWILHDPAYAPAPNIVSQDDIKRMIANAKPTEAECAEVGLGFWDESEHIYGSKRWLSQHAKPPLPEMVSFTVHDMTKEEKEDSIKATGKKIAAIYQKKYEDHNTEFERGFWGEQEDPGKAELDYLTQPAGLLGKICSWINSTSLRPQPYLTLACALTFLGALFGRKVRDHLGSRTNLYSMTVAPSSAGKAHAMNQVRFLCMEAGCVDLLGGDDIASDSAIESRMAREPATLFLWDEVGHLLVHIKSGASKHHAQVVSLLMKLYSAAGNVYLGREYADDDNQRTIEQPCCCVYGTSTPDKFTEGISPGELDDGWLSRCLVFYTSDKPKKRRGIDMSTPPPPEVVELIRDWANRTVVDESEEKAISQFVVGSTKDLRKAPPKQITVPTLPDAEQRFIAFDDESERYGEQYPSLATLWAKAEENARRIALILACSDSYDSPTITAANADHACRLVKMILNDIGKYIVPEIVGGKVEADKRKIIRVIQRMGATGGVKRDITRGTRWAGNRQRNDLLTDLTEAGEIVCRAVEGTVRYWTAGNAPASEGASNE